jgi:hypothetical protein
MAEGERFRAGELGRGGTLSYAIADAAARHTGVLIGLGRARWS